MGAYAGRGLHGEVVEILGRRILAGDVTEGQTLDPTRLEVDLDVSRTVIREALRVLKAKGLVDARQKRGTFVLPRREWNLLDADIMRWQFEANHGDDLITDLSEVRGIIEPASARLAALRRTEDDLEVLDQALDMMLRAAQGEGSAVAADLAFHGAVFGATHNEMLVQMEAVMAAGLVARDQMVHGGIPDDDPTPAHASVRDAIVDGDPDAAEQAMRGLLAKSVLDVERIREGTQA
ncbi:MAG: FCD domain-containing protein [Streptosporangiales bacterium]|nr:FCD domain-containing protein [Streptosporangiales bacterium]